jgi:hypothetical protein
MDGAVRMTASQSQASSKRIHLAGAFCSIPRTKTASACKAEKRKVVADRGSALLAQRRWSTVLLLVFRSFRYAVWGSAMQRIHLCQEVLNSPSSASILSGFPSTVPISRRPSWSSANKLAEQPTTAVLFFADVPGVIYVCIDETTYMVGQRD